MTAGGLPGVTILLDDGTGTFPYDVSAYGRWSEGLTGTRGRQDELSQVTAPQPTLVLDNADGRFSFGSTLIGSPSPILVDQKVRVKFTANATTVNRYTGTLIAAPVSFPGGGDEFSIATVTLADVQAQAERRTLRSIIEEEILSDLPSAYYVLNEPAGALSAVDSSGNQSPAMIPAGSGAAYVLGSAAGPTTDGYTALQLAGGQYLSPSPNGDANASTWGIEAAFQRNGTPAVVEGLIPDPTATFWSTTMDTSGRIQSYGGTSPLSYADGKIHHVFVDVLNGKLYVDGALVVSGGGTPLPASVPIAGVLAHVAYYRLGTTLPSAARIAAHAAAVLTGFDGESGTARLTRLAGYAGIPVGTFDTSLTNVAFEDITGKTAMAAMQDVADAEFGLVFFDGSGNLTFHNRNRAVAKTAPDITIDANQLDPGTAFFYDNQGILNYVTVTAQGTQVAQVARNTVSELGAAGSPKHGRYSDSKTYLVKTDAEALDRGNWLVNRHGQPAPRAGSLVVTLLDLTPAQQAAWLAVEPNYWIRITGLPAQTPGGTTADLIVQGWAETLNAPESGATWTLALNTSSRPAYYQGWILDDVNLSVLDSTTRLFI